MPVKLHDDISQQQRQQLVNTHLPPALLEPLLAFLYDPAHADCLPPLLQVQLLHLSMSCSFRSSIVAKSCGARLSWSLGPVSGQLHSVVLKLNSTLHLLMATCMLDLGCSEAQAVCLHCACWH